MRLSRRNGCRSRSTTDLKRIWILLLLAALGPLSAPAAETLNPYPRVLLDKSTIAEWRFPADGQKWRIQQDATLETAPGSYRLQITGPDPMLISPAVVARGTIHLRVRLRTTAPGPIQFFWWTEKQPGYSEANSARAGVVADGEWHEYGVTVFSKSPWKRVRFDPAGGPGTVEIEWLRMEQHSLHPLEIEGVEATEDQYIASIRNHGDESRNVNLEGQSFSLAAGEVARKTLARPAPTRPFEIVTLKAESDGLPFVTRPLLAINPAVDGKWLTLQHGDITCDVAGDGTGARLLRKGKLIAYLAPLAWRDGEIPLLTVKQDGNRLTATGGPVMELALWLDDEGLHYSLQASEEMEGPVLRAAGKLEQGLLAGVEHLGKGESSSSTLDIHGPEHVRFRPDPMHVTMPLMVFVTDLGSVAMAWDEMTLQPTFATPNFYDGTADHRCSLQGKHVQAIVRIGASFLDGERLEDSVLWAVRRRGLPGLPTPPRSPEEQTNLLLTAFEQSVIKGKPGGWYHAGIPGGKSLPDRPQPFGDVYSTLFRLTGALPDTQAMAPGGSHIENDASFFITGQAAAWLERRTAMARQAARRQLADGSYRYQGPYQEGHFEDTASGHCARPAVTLLEHAKWTGDAESLAAGLKTLDYIKRFRTPRGASVWECPLHAPDLLASALLVRAYVLGFELTGREEYRTLAVRWALSGVPYVYQWSNRPIMLYATTGTLCATHYQAPVWIGRPVQWMGIVYADCLLDLAPYDETLNWRQLARGILISGEQQQYPDGPSIGCLADSLLLAEQQRLPFDINPSALASLRLRLDDKPAGLATARSERHRIVAPFPVTLEGDVAKIKAPPGLRYDVLIDGHQVVSVQSTGEDQVPLTDGGSGTKIKD